ncbi:MAG: hypothetical protein KDJ31_13505 [Candidatus Competibacteraceae bacterium]|nr:hypothetical protein [Candidatus Competibacteraceae bacterium]MCB1820646.1 hypothetical protein [Candidatus Competibacteraceae bacterium]
MSQVIIENPVINSPFGGPQHHFQFDELANGDDVNIMVDKQWVHRAIDLEFDGSIPSRTARVVIQEHYQVMIFPKSTDKQRYPR